jgi:TRAP-type C4-dicarboxylate transport system substrate-binding protein
LKIRKVLQNQYWAGSEWTQIQNLRRIKIMRKRIMFIAIVVLSVAILPFVVYGQPAAKMINMKFATYFPPPSAHAKLWEEFCREIEKRSNGRVKITFYAGGTLLGAVPMADGVTEGIADIGLFNVNYTPGRYPVSEAATLPLGYPTGWVSSHVMDDFWREFKPKELDKLHLLTAASHGPLVIWSKDPIYKMEDLKGKRIRQVGLGADMLKLLGGSPSSIPAGESYEAMAKGVLDGIGLPLETGKTWKFAEVSKYVIYIGGVSNFGVFYTAMNRKSWDSLPKDIQAVFDAVSVEWVEKSARMWNEIDLEGLEFSIERGVKFIELSPEEKARWQKAVQPVIEQYVKDMVARGFSEQEVRHYLEYARNRNDYWIKKQTELGIKTVTGPK